MEVTDSGTEAEDAMGLMPLLNQRQNFLFPLPVLITKENSLALVTLVKEGSVPIPRSHCYSRINSTTKTAL